MLFALPFTIENLVGVRILSKPYHFPCSQAIPTLPTRWGARVTNDWYIIFGGGVQKTGTLIFNNLPVWLIQAAKYSLYYNTNESIGPYQLNICQKKITTVFYICTYLYLSTSK